jgi:2-dehydro-3-deoxygluconokinase
VDALCLGESMALFVPAEPGPAENVRAWTRSTGGAESNVACHLAGLGVRAAWVSAVGDDPFGRAVVDFVAGHGVDTSGVVVDPDRPTGVYFKTPGGVRYYRRGSAAAALGPALLADLPRADLVHTSGITPALSDSCRALMTELLHAPRTHVLSFDVNRRPALDQDPELLRDLAARADVVLVGQDEAEALWGAADPAAIRRLLPGPREVVVKQAHRGATVVGPDGATVFEPALRVAVVEEVGAGDAFAAGYLAALLAGEPPARRLRAGHLRAASALRTSDDVGPPLPPALVAALLDASEDEWRAAHIQ